MKEFLNVEKDMIKRRHKSKQEKLKYYNEWKSSGLSRNKFCTLHNLKLATFTLWVRQIEKESPSKMRFMPLETISAKKKELGVVEIEFSNGVKCRVSNSEAIDNVLVLMKGLHDAFTADPK